MEDTGDVLSAALALGDEGRWEEMAELLATALASAPDDPYLLGWLGVAEQELGNDGAAYEYFRRCLAEDPLDPHLLALAGSGLAAFDDPEAETALRAAALTGPDVAMARLQYGAYLARAGMLDEALEQLRAARDLEPEDPVVYGELGVVHALRSEPGPAVEHWETALKLAPDDAWTRLLMGLVLAEHGELQSAAEALLEAAREREEDFEAQVLGALAAAAVGWDDAAQGALARAGMAVEAGDAALLTEVEDRVDSGAAEAAEMLRETLGPSVLRERLAEPL